MKSMKVRFVGFGGYMEKPCYEDENGQLYFNSDQLLNQYNQLYNELNKLAQEKFTTPQSKPSKT